MSDYSPQSLENVKFFPEFFKLKSEFFRQSYNVHKLNTNALLLVIQ